MHLNNKKQMANENNSIGCCCFLNKHFSVYLFPGYGWFSKIDTGFSLQPENIFTYFFTSNIYNAKRSAKSQWDRSSDYYEHSIIKDSGPILYLWMRVRHQKFI